MPDVGSHRMFDLREGSSALVVSIPHAGVFVPPEIAARLTPRARAVPDTDWHVDKLYGFLAALDVTVLTARVSRYVVDLNRGPEGGVLYPGQAETGICPTETFAGEALYEGAVPDAAEIAARVAVYWRPYHAALEAALAGARARHGSAILLDAHSIPAEVPRLFAGRLPDLNFGTNDGASADPLLVGRVMAACADSGFSQVLNGRFKGGYITRHYGAPRAGVQAIQLELAQDAYMDEGRPEVFDYRRAEGLVGALRQVVTTLAESGSV